MSPPEGTAAPARWLPAGLLTVAAGLVVVALLGPLVSGAIDYRVSETLRYQTIGLDLVSLAVVAPLAATAAFLIARCRHPLGYALALGVGAYTAYMFVQYVLGPEYASRAGDNERLFPLALVLFTVGWGVALGAWNAVDAEDLALSGRRARVVSRYVLPVLALLAFGRYVPALVDWMSGSPTDEGYLAGPTFAWAIAMLDLGVFLPLTAAACIGVEQGRRWAAKALVTAVGWFGFVGLAVAAMAISMHLNDDPTSSTADTAFLTLLGAVFLVLAIAVLWPLARGRPTRERAERGDGGSRTRG